MFTSTIANIQKSWEHWNIHFVILMSLAMQIFLIMSSPLRKRVQRGLVLFPIWVAYLLADWAANFCVGLIASKQIANIKTNITTHDDLLAFWAPFLLMHLGGPDTITAFSLEDNELWLRHLLGFIIQVISCVYVFLLTLPKNELWIPTVLVFIAGIIKYGERTYSLYLGSYDTFRDSMNGKPNAGHIYSNLADEANGEAKATIICSEESDNNGHQLPTPQEEELTNVDVVRHAYLFFDKFKGIIVDKFFSFSDRDKSREYFCNLSAEDSLRVIEIELNFYYEAFYTKFFVVRSKLGYFSRFLAIICVVSAFGFFSTLNQHKYDFKSFEVRVTYALMCGAMALDITALFMILFSDRTIVSFQHPYVSSLLEHSFLRWKRPVWSICNKKPFPEFKALSTWLLCRRWNGYMSCFNLITYSDPKNNALTPIIGLFPQIKYWSLVMKLHKDKIPMIYELWEFIILELIKKHGQNEDLRRVCNYRGEWILHEKAKEAKEGVITQGGVITEEKIKKLCVDPNEVAFDESLITWHVATHLLWCEDGGGGDSENDEKIKRAFSKILSDYMLYLLVLECKIISAIAGIGQKRFQDTLAEATQFFQDVRAQNEAEACNKLLEVPTDNKPVDVRGDVSKSLLFDACILAKELRELKDKWGIICQVWVELLSFAACNCRVSAHVQRLSNGGELISLVWMLMVHLGLSKQFQESE